MATFSVGSVASSSVVWGGTAGSTSLRITHNGYAWGGLATGVVTSYSITIYPAPVDKGTKAWQEIFDGIRELEGGKSG